MFNATLSDMKCNCFHAHLSHVVCRLELTDVPKCETLLRWLPKSSELRRGNPMPESERKIPYTCLTSNCLLSNLNLNTERDCPRLNMDIQIVAEKEVFGVVKTCKVKPGQHHVFDKRL
jgi:hypothetical protein